MDEPRDEGAMVLAGGPPDMLVGYPPVAVVYVRHDAAEDADPRRWWPLVGDDAYPVTWGEVAHVQVAGPDGTRWEPQTVTRVYTQADVDAAVEAARRDAQVVPVGEHLMEPGGHCRTCGHRHSNTEWARIHDAEAGHG